MTAPMKSNPRYPYLLRVLIAIDQLANVVFLNGSEDHTISGRVGHKAKTTNKWYWLALEKFINILFFFDKNHCRRSIERDELHNKY
ncbi:PH domain-containing protein [Pseudoalteromonas peptidolytica]|uniref:Uncharacterized protein n=1 Tax=Pseudoalteromonas peptidolytica F12-50-A1 TaxID=1315280 RepID=A0A8I0N039_9GAMM|nr:DNA helicase UvrD [Pseudoalteromonas peptidolytica]MBE0348295.1 hypothetical protein [Pseudoalteromonas peptidolytica F12-50-A1]NLR16579.1 DNA helicase UvrD [Pseudoalteromonas peptidolytica]GEK08949.1 hypothetical protein PPE03_11980 [Pseudoalteromonas peptidolytica]